MHPLIKPVASALALLLAGQAHAGIVVYSRTSNGGLAGFNMAAGAPPVSIDFDDLAPGTNLNGTTLAGVLFQPSATGAPLLVVPGNDTFTPSGFSGVDDPATNKLFPTSGANVLSPGGLTLGPGPNNPVENDDLVLTFQDGLTAFGFDHLSQSADGASFTRISVFNQSNVQLFSGTIPISNLGGGGAPGGADFWGAVATGSDRIARVVIDDQDGDSQFPDANIGYDSFRFFAPAAAVPEPPSLALLGVSMVGLTGWTFQRRSRTGRCGGGRRAE